MSEPIDESANAEQANPATVPESPDSQAVSAIDESPPSGQERLAELEGVCEELAERVQDMDSRLSKCEAQLKEHGQALEAIRTRQMAVEASEEVESVHKRWLIADIWHDLRLVVGMFRDGRYRVAWTTTVAGLAALIYLTVWPALRHGLGWSWHVPVLSYVDNLVVAYVGLKVMSRELRRYEHFLQTRRAR